MFVASEIICDRFAGQDCKYISHVFDVDYIKNEIDDFDSGGPFGFYVKRGETPNFNFVFAAGHYVPWFVFNYLFYLSRMN